MGRSDRYPLTETPERNDQTRTRRNSEDSDGTLILNQGTLDGGTALTVTHARKMGKPYRVVALEEGIDPAVFRDWLDANYITVLNVAGPRAAVVEAESFAVGHSQTQGRAVGLVQQGLLVHEAPGDDQQVMIEDVERVEQGPMGVGQISDEQGRLVRQKRVGRRAAGAVGGGLALPGRRHPDHEPHAPVVHQRLGGFNRLQGAAGQRFPVAPLEKRPP